MHRSRDSILVGTSYRCSLALVSTLIESIDTFLVVENQALVALIRLREAEAFNSRCCEPVDREVGMQVKGATRYS